MTPEQTQRTLSGLDPNSTGGTGIRNLQISGGDSAAQLSNTSSAAKMTSTAYQNFIMKVMNLLQQSQQLGTAPLQNQALDLQQEQVNRTMAPATPGAPPSIQAGIRSADVQAVQPSLTGVQNQARTFSEQLQGFGSAVDKAVALGGWMNDMAQKDKQEAQNLVLNYPDAVVKMPEKQAKELFSKAGIPWDLKDALVSKQDTWSDPYTLSSGDLAQKNAKTGEIKVISKVSETGVAATQTATKAKQEALNGINLVNTILDDPNLNLVTGLSRFTPKSVFSPETQYIKNQIEQLKKTLSIENRQKLKGQGTISDFEGKMLEQASTALTRSLAYPDLLRELAKIKGAFQTYAGIPVNVRVTSPTGETIEATVTRDEIDALISEGNQIEFI